MKTIIKIEPEWNNAHCSIADAEEVLPGWAELPEALKSVWEEHGPFVAIVLLDWMRYAVEGGDKPFYKF